MMTSLEKFALKNRMLFYNLFTNLVGVWIVLILSFRSIAPPFYEIADFAHRECNAKADLLAISDPPGAFMLLYGLVVQDTQIRVLLGEPPPTRREIERRAEDAIADFLRLTGTG